MGIFLQQYVPESPSVKKESDQLLSGQEDKTSLSSSLWVSNFYSLNK